MADRRLLQMPRVEMDVAIRLTSAEVRALDALAGYGIEPFLKVFYAQMGQHYLKPHEAGLRSLFETVRSELPTLMRRHDAARQAFALADPVIRSRKDHDELVARVMEQAAAKALANAATTPADPQRKEGE